MSNTCLLPDVDLFQFDSPGGGLTRRSSDHRSKEHLVFCKRNGGSGADCAALLHTEYVWPSVVTGRNRSCLHDQPYGATESVEGFCCRRIPDSTSAVGGSAVRRRLVARWEVDRL